MGGCSASQRRSAPTALTVRPPSAQIGSTASGCSLSQLRIRRHDRGLAFGKVHRVDAGLLRQLLEQAVKTFLIDSVVLNAFGFLRYLCDQTLQLLRRGAVFEVLERGETASDAGPLDNVGSPGAHGAAEHARQRHRTEQS